MQLIPVIDIKEGIAVHAKPGLREHYQPLHTALCPSNKITKIVDCFLEIHPFKIIYLADLNAITNCGDNQVFIKKLLLHYPHVNFWVDSGYQQQPSSLSRFNNYQTVLGSESYEDNALNDLNSFEKNFILSLDFSTQGHPLGSKRLFNEKNLWPRQIILMTLARVGSGLGVDFNMLNYYQQLNSKIDFIAAGGIRTIDDVLRLQKIGIQKALCASALHNQAISSDDMKKL